MGLNQAGRWRRSVKGAGGGRRPASECGGEGVSGKGGGGAKKKDTVSAHIARLVRNAPTLRRKNFFRRHNPGCSWLRWACLLVYFLPRCEAQTELSAGTAFHVGRQPSPSPPPPSPSPPPPSPSPPSFPTRWVAHTPACLAGFKWRLAMRLS